MKADTIQIKIKILCTYFSDFPADTVHKLRDTSRFFFYFNLHINDNVYSRFFTVRRNSPCYQCQLIGLCFFYHADVIIDISHLTVYVERIGQMDVKLTTLRYVECNVCQGRWARSSAHPVCISIFAAAAAAAADIGLSVAASATGRTSVIEQLNGT